MNSKSIPDQQQTWIDGIADEVGSFYTDPPRSCSASVYAARRGETMTRKWISREHWADPKVCSFGSFDSSAIQALKTGNEIVVVIE
jgi:hypothetical protein